MTPERSGNPRPLKGSGDTERSGNPRPTRKTIPERIPSGSLEPFGINPNRPPDAKNWSNLCRTVWALINNPSLLVGRDNSLIIFPVVPQKGNGAASNESSSSSSSSDSSSSSSSGSSSSDSSKSSGPSSESGSSKDSAVVRGPNGGYLKWYCMEATEVLFFDFQEFAVSHGTSSIEIDPVVLFCTESGTLRAFGSPDVGNVNVTVNESNVVVRARFTKARKQQVVQVMLKGTRRGFKGVRNEAASFEIFVDNECRLNPRMTRKQIIEELAKRGVTE